MYGPVDPQGHRIAQLLHRLLRAKREDHRLAASRLDQADGLFDAALLVRADGEAEVLCLERGRFRVEHHLAARERHSLDADQYPHQGPPRTRGGRLRISRGLNTFKTE